MAAAVSNAGGLGSIAIAGSEPDAIREQIAKLRSLTSRPFNVNLFVLQTIPTPDVVQVSV
jgi:nitronate monooxygenase